jgi:cytochrome c-type biogenesis protein CcmH
MEWAVVTALFVLSAMALLYPLWWRTEEPLPAGIEGAADDETLERLDEKRRLLVNLRSLRSEAAEGKLAEDDFRRLEAEYEQQLARVLEAIERGGQAKKKDAAVEPRKDMHRFGSIVLLLFLAVPAFLLLAFSRQTPPGLDHGGQAPDILAMVAKLEQRLRANPNDLEGQLMLARSYATLGKGAEAAQIWAKVLALEPNNREARSSLAISLLQTGDQLSLRAGLQHLRTLRTAEPDEPAWLWYESVALARLGQKAEAKAALQKILTLIPPDSENGRMVREALKQLE